MAGNDFEKLLQSMKEEEKKKKSDQAPQKKVVMDTFIKKDGEYVFRIFPNLKDPQKSPFLKIFLHLGYTLPNTGKPYPFKCLGGSCPLCANYEKKKSKKEADAWKYESREKFIYYALDKKGDLIRLNLTEAQHKELFGAIQAELTHKKDAYNPMDLEKGCFIKFKKETREKNNKKIPVYTVQVVRKSSSAIKPKLLAVLKKLPSLGSNFKNFSENDLKKILKGEKISFKKEKKVEPKEVFKKEEVSKKEPEQGEEAELDLSKVMEGTDI